jgi:hypothetical protein
MEGHEQETGEGTQGPATEATDEVCSSVQAKNDDRAPPELRLLRERRRNHDRLAGRGR